MSTEAMKWAIEQAPPMPAQLVGTLIGLAWHADKEGRGAYPSMGRLAAYACKAERSVRRDLRQLEELGLIRPGDSSRVEHLPADRRPEVYDLAVERVVAGGRAGADEGTRASARSVVSSRARGGKKKPSSDQYRGDVDVRADADVRADVGVTHGRTPTSQRADAHVRDGRTPTSAKPPVEPPENRQENLPLPAAHGINADPATGAEDGSEIQDLIAAMATRGMNVSWPLNNSEWFTLRDTIRRVGIPALIDHAARAWQAARNQPYSARYFLAGWNALQTPPPYTGPRPLGATGPSKAADYLADMAAIANELRNGGTL